MSQVLSDRLERCKAELRAEREAREKAEDLAALQKVNLDTYAKTIAPLRERAEKAEEALEAFASPVSTSRVADGDEPELDTLTLEVKAGDWIRACVVLGRMDVAYLRRLYEPARPSEKFIASLSAVPVPRGEERDVRP